MTSSLAHRQGTNVHVRHNYISPFSSLRSSDLRFLSFGFCQLLFQLSNLFLQIGLGFLVAGLFSVKFLYLFLYGFLFLFGLRFGNGGLQISFAGFKFLILRPQLLQLLFLIIQFSFQH